MHETNVPTLFGISQKQVIDMEHLYSAMAIRCIHLYCAEMVTKIGDPMHWCIAHLVQMLRLFVHVSYKLSVKVRNKLTVS